MTTIPKIFEIKEILTSEALWPSDSHRTALLVSNKAAGKRNRYDLIGIKHETGEAVCLGIELTLGHCRKIAFGFVQNTMEKE